MSAAAYDLEEIIKLAIELGVQRMKELKPELQAMAIRQKRPNPAELLAFVADKVQEHPPEPWLRPDAVTLVNGVLAARGIPTLDEGTEATAELLEGLGLQSLWVTIAPWVEMTEMNLAENAKEWWGRIEKALAAQRMVA